MKMPKLLASQTVSDLEFDSVDSVESPPTLPSSSKSKTKSNTNESSKRKRPEKKFTILNYMKRRKLDFNDLQETTLSEIVDDSKFSDEQIVIKGSDLMKKVVKDEFASIDQLERFTQYLKRLKSLNKRLDNLLLNQFLSILNELIKKGILEEKNSSELSDVEYKQSLHVCERSSQAATIIILFYTFSNIPQEDIRDILSNIYLFFTAQLDHFVGDDFKKQKKKYNVPESVENKLVDNLILCSQMFTSPLLITNNLYGLISKCLYLIFQEKKDSLISSAVYLIVGLFKTHPDLRSYILGEVVFAVKNLSDNHKLKIDYIVNGNTKTSIIVLLLLNMMQCTVKDTQEEIGKCYEEVWIIGGNLVMSFLNRCNTQDEDHKIFRSMFDQIVVELIKLWRCPELPAASLMIQLISKPAAEIILANKDPMLRSFCLKIITKVGVKLINDQKLYSQNHPVQACQILISEYLKKTEEAKFYHASQFHHMLWCVNGMKQIPQQSKVQSKASVSLEMVEQAEYSIDTTRKSFKGYEVYMNYVLKTCVDQNKKVKSTAALCLSEMIETEPSLLSNGTIQKAIQECINSSAAAARDSICSLIGKHIIEVKDDFNKYYDLMAKMLEDPTVSVKKTAINVMQKCISVHSNLKQKADICYRILKLIQDQESTIQNIVVNFFSNLWINFDCKAHLGTLIQLVRYPNALSYLKLFFEENLKPQNTLITAKTQTQPSTQTQQIYTDLIGELFNAAKHPQNAEPCLDILLLVLNIRPQIGLQFIQELNTILKKNDSRNDYVVPNKILEILTLVVPVESEHNIRVYRSMYEFITKFALSKQQPNYPIRYLISSMKLLRIISNIIKAPFIKDWFQPSLTMLEKNIEGETYHSWEIMRSLNIMCYLLRFASEATRTQAQNIMFHFIEKTKFNINVIHALCYVLMEDKSTMQSSKLQEILYCYLDEGSEEIRKTAALHAIIYYLKNWKEVGSMSLKVQGEENTEVASSFIQKCLHKVLECTYSLNENIRSMSCQVVEHILNNGIIIEPRLFPHVIAFASDPLPIIQAIGTRLLTNIRMKKKWDLTRSAVRGFILSLHLLETINKNIVRGFVETNEVVKCRNEYFYKNIQEDVISRRRLVDNLVRDISGTKINNREKLYLVDHLASFPYKYQDEVIYILHQIVLIFSNIHVPDKCPIEGEDAKSFMNQNYGYFLLHLLKNKMQSVLSVTDQRIDKYISNPVSSEMLHRKLTTADYISKEIFDKFGTTVPAVVQLIFSDLKKIVTLESDQSSLSSLHSSPIKTSTRTRITKTTTPKTRNKLSESTKTNSKNKSETSSKKSVTPVSNGTKEFKTRGSTSKKQIGTSIKKNMPEELGETPRRGRSARKNEPNNNENYSINEN